MTDIKKPKGRTEELLTAVRNGKVLSSREEIDLVIRLAVPAILAQLSFIAMSYIDAAMVGHLGANESASVGLMGSTLWLFWGISGAVITGFSVQVAHRIGAKEGDAAKSIMCQSMLLVTLWTALMGLIGFLIAPYLPGWLGGDPAIRPDATAYFGISVVLFPLCVSGWFAGSMLRVAGNMKVPSLLDLLMCILDVVFNFFLIFPCRDAEILGFKIWIPGAGMGVAGAAWGSVIAEIIVGVWMLWYLVKRSEHLSLIGFKVSFKLEREVLRRAFNIGSPIGLERVIMCGAQIAFTMIVAPLGIVPIAAHSLAITAESLCYMPGYGIAEAATTLIGQTLGAKRKDLTKTFAWQCVWIGMGIMTIMGILMYVTAPILMASMTQVPEVIELGARVLRIEAWAEPLFAAAIVSYGIFVGAGDTLMPCVINLGSVWCVRIVLAFFLAPVYGLAGVWTAMCVELCVRGSLFLLRLKFGNWMDRAKLS